MVFLWYHCISLKRLFKIYHTVDYTALYEATPGCTPLYLALLGSTLSLNGFKRIWFKWFKLLKCSIAMSWTGLEAVFLCGANKYIKTGIFFCLFLFHIFIGPRSLDRSDLWVELSVTEWVSEWVSERRCWNFTDVTPADEDTNSILTDKVNRTIQGNVAKQL